MIYAIYYGLLGVITGFLMEIAVVSTGEVIRGQERFWLIVLWPIMSMVFAYNFFKKLFNG